MEAHPEVVASFTRVFLIDEDDHIHYDDDGKPWAKAFIYENRDRFEWLSHFYYKGNCLCHPSAMIRKEEADKLGGENPDFGQLADLDKYIRLCFEGELFILDDYLTYMRFLNDNRNYGAPRKDSANRTQFEFSKILHLYTHPFVLENFSQIFLGYHGGNGTAEKLYFLVQESYSGKKNFKKFFAAELFYQILRDQKLLTELQTKKPSIRKEFFDMVGDTEFSNWKASHELKKAKAKLKHQKSAHEKEVRKIYSSFTWKLGYVILTPFRWLSGIKAR
jgi:hypothetical protein